jgi:spore germination protein YaaH
MLCLILCLPGKSAAQDYNRLPFQDLSDSYAVPAILSLYEKQLLNGTGDSKFEPHRAITRAEMTVLICRLFGLEPVPAAISPFSDMASDNWYYPWVQAALQAGIVQGTAANRFDPGKSVTREETAVMVVRAAKLATSTENRQIYEDQSRIANYAIAAVMRLHELGLMRGDGTTFRPKDSLSRQEAAVLMHQVINKPGWSDRIKADTGMGIQLGWQYLSNTAIYKQQILRSDINTLSPRWFYLNQEGLATSGFDESLVTWAHERGKHVWAMFGNRADQSMTHHFLNNDPQRQSVIAQLAEKVKTSQLDGINVDFENVAPKDRNAFTRFIAELATALRPLGAVLSIDLSPDMGTDWTQAYDYAELGRLADYLVLMGYDEHWGGSNMGSVSSLPWIRSGLAKLVKLVPANKVILGLPFYTREWRLSQKGLRSDYLSLQEQNALVLQRKLPLRWDETLGQYVTSDQLAGESRHIWLEDGRSLSGKIRLGEQVGVAGYAYWYMGGESADIWPSIRNAIRMAGYRFE